MELDQPEDARGKSDTKLPASLVVRVSLFPHHHRLDDVDGRLGGSFGWTLATTPGGDRFPISFPFSLNHLTLTSPKTRRNSSMILAFSGNSARRRSR
jgi:hypothetical protein